LGQTVLDEGPQLWCQQDPVVLGYGDVEHRRGEQQELVVARQLPSPRPLLPANIVITGTKRDSQFLYGFRRRRKSTASG